MRRDALLFGLAGAFFGLVAGWIIGSMQPPTASGMAAAPQVRSVPAPAASTQAAPPLDEARAAELKAAADRSPKDSTVRVQLGDVYFDAERFEEARQWYEAALALDPKNINASTDLGITYYYTNQPDRAIAQFERSLSVDPKHTKTLLNMGVVRAFGKGDLAGASTAWEQVLQVAPAGSPEAVTAKRMLDGIKAHPPMGEAPQQKPPGQPD